MTRSKIPSVNGSNNGVACRPHIAGWTCDGMRSHPVGHDSYHFPTLDVFCTGRTYPEAFYSGVLPADAVADIVNWAAKNDGVFTVPQQWCSFPGQYTWHGYIHVKSHTCTCSRTAFANVLHCAGTFNSHGWGYGLLQHDYIEQFLVFTFAVSAHAQTRGTWTASECIGGLDRSISSPDSASGYAAPSQTVVPTLIKWMMLFEEPLKKQLWIAKGMPREWLLHGKPAVSLNGSPTRYGRISFSLQAVSANDLQANITLPDDFVWPDGGMKLRLRTPGFLDGKHLKNITVGDQSWSDFNATEETIFLTHSAIGHRGGRLIIRATVG